MANETNVKEKSAEEIYAALCVTKEVKDFVTQITPETWINICPVKEINSVIADGFTVQGEYTNATDYKVNAVADGVLANVKALCTQQISAWKRIVEKMSEKFPAESRNQAIERLRKTRTGSELEERATMAEALKEKLS